MDPTSTRTGPWSFLCRLFLVRLAFCLAAGIVVWGLCYLLSTDGGDHRRAVTVPPTPLSRPALPSIPSLVSPFGGSGAAGDTLGAASGSGGWTTYEPIGTDRGTDFRIDYPADWTADESVENQTLTLTPSTAGAAAAVGWAGVQDGGGFAAYVSGVREHLDSLPGSRETAYAPVTLGGLHGYHLTATVDDGGRPATAEFWCLTDGTSAWTVATLVADGADSTLAQQAQHVASTFRPYTGNG